MKWYFWILAAFAIWFAFYFSTKGGTLLGGPAINPNNNPSPSGSVDV